ncbi:O-antigen ligase family protein [Phenylobacterium sp.]|jgi:O-antigen ligase|uniref:O-antigen ligase family protein n=1 Tax=Phenylobacterium sp. TaxID=1871053 RepID=UPI002F926FF8
MARIRDARADEAHWWRLQWWAQDARWLGFCGPALLFAAHGAYGAMPPKTSLSLAAALAALLLACAATPRLQAGLPARQLRLPATFFAATLAVVLWSLTPFPLGGPHPVWDFAGVSPPAGTIDRSQTLLELVKLLGLGCAFGGGLYTGSSDGRARIALNVVLALGSAYALWSLLTFVSGAFGPGFDRLGASFAAPNTAATLFAILLVLAAGAFFSKIRRERPGHWTAAAPEGCAALLSFGCLIATASRGGFTAAAAGLITFGGLLMARGRVTAPRALVATFASVALVLLLVAALGDQLIDRALAAPHEVQDRQALFATHWEAFLAAPAMGYGLGTFDLVNRIQLHDGNVQALWASRAVHNVYLGWLEQAGLAGATAMFGSLVAVMALTLRAGLRRSRMTTLLFALVAADVVVLVHGLSDFALETYSVAAFWSWLLGLQFAAAQGSSR